MMLIRGILPVYSHLFRRETARRLRATACDVTNSYQSHRAVWLNAYSRPDREAILAALEMLAQSVAVGKGVWYYHYAQHEIDEYLAGGMPPIALLAAADLLFETILRSLTPDQQELVDPILAEVRFHLQAIVQDWLLRHQEAVGA
ncbi:MAG: hypothetical protein M3Z66_02150 [Chloroflexota bacterium]|nr:hypothetical protein [Chloroflexota bacterium]